MLEFLMDLIFHYEGYHSINTDIEGPWFPVRYISRGLSISFLLIDCSPLYIILYPTTTIVPMIPLDDIHFMPPKWGHPGKNVGPVVMLSGSGLEACVVSLLHAQALAFGDSMEHGRPRGPSTVDGCKVLRRFGRWLIHVYPVMDNVELCYQ